jgi:hypothetical protein
MIWKCLGIRGMVTSIRMSPGEGVPEDYWIGYFLMANSKYSDYLPMADSEDSVNSESVYKPQSKKPAY